MGMVISPTGPEESHIIRSPFCSCEDGGRTRVGVIAGFWEPVRLIDVVKDPMCMAGLGMSMGGDGDIWGGGGKQASGIGKQQGQGSFYQAHLYIYPVWTILELFADYLCAERGSFDIAYMTELDPLWDDDLLTVMIQPEAILFANPVAQMSCMADSVASAVSWPLQPLFWCAGSWGGTYPLTGRTDNRTMTEGAAHIAGKLLYKLHRELIMLGTAGEGALCGPFIAPTWLKNQYKLQIVRPVKGSVVTTIGRTGLIWGAGKNPAVPGQSDNFSFILFRNRDCCAY
jgi:conjugal transfer pilus assembly protein TraU